MYCTVFWKLQQPSFVYSSLIARFTGPTWSPPRSWPGPRVAPCWSHESCYLEWLLVTKWYGVFKRLHYAFCVYCIEFVSAVQLQNMPFLFKLELSWNLPDTSFDIEGLQFVNVPDFSFLSTKFLLSLYCLLVHDTSAIGNWIFLTSFFPHFDG